MTSRLALLHSRLARLRRLRAAVVVLSAAAAAGAALSSALFAVFLLDWLFGLDVYQRLIVMFLAGGGLVYFWRKIWRQCAGQRADEVAAALWVERQHQIDSDLVAAIQFERDARGQLASQRLSAAVVEYVAEAAPTIDVFRGFSVGPLWRRLTACGGCMLLGGVLLAAVPNHLRTFGHRLLLGSQTYPTRTQIERVLVGETVVYERGKADGRLLEAKGAEGQPLVFTVVCSGARPRSVVVQAESAAGSAGRARVALKAQATGQNPSYGGELPRLHEDVRYWVVAGDALSEVGIVRLIPLPTVEVELKATAPSYAAGWASSEEQGPGGKSVLEGSTVELIAVSTNRKPLRAVSVTLHGSMGKADKELVAADEQKLVWRLPADDSPLAAVKEDVRYELVAVDVDGLTPLVPVRGVIRVHPDGPPTAAASVVHRLVLPTAQPMIGYRAGDDHGLASLTLVVDVERVDPAPPANEAAAEAAKVVAETRRIPISLGETVLTSDHLPLDGAYALNLAPLGLAKGDRLKLMLEATDHRGEMQGKTAASEALVLEVGDEGQVLAAIRQADERSEAQLNEIIRRQLGVGQEQKNQ